MMRAIAPANCFHFDSSAASCFFALLPRSGLPFRRQPSFAFEAMQGGIERAMLDLKHVFAGPLDVLGDLVAMSRAELKGTQNEHVEGALQEFNAVVGWLGHLLVDILP